MKVTVIPTVLDVIGTVAKRLDRRLEYLVWKNQDHGTEEIGYILEKICCHSDSKEEPPVKTGGKNSQGEIITCSKIKVFHF